MLCQITMEIDGCRLIAFSGAYKAVVECLIRLAEDDGGTVEENGPIFLACDTILKSSFKEEIGVHIDDSYFIKLFGVLSSWAEDDVDWSSTMMAASICSLILDSTSETVLECHPHFTRKLTSRCRSCSNCCLGYVFLLDKKPDEVPMPV
ncbi:hypothetical protein Lser_V15G02633 [Lactuca serriola]